KFGAGGGFVDTFDTNGNFLARVASNGPLQAPWGLAIAPSTFGQFANDLLVGNFADGRISAFDPSTFAFLGQITLPGGTPFSEPGLWSLVFGGGGVGGDQNTLFFSAGINNEANGLFGSLNPITPEPSAAILLGLGGVMLGIGRRWLARKA